jgi:putative ATPase
MVFMDTDFNLLSAMDAGDEGEDLNSKPLAIRMRPSTLDEVIGQDKALAIGSPLRRLSLPFKDRMSMAPSAVILYGPPGVGKTTLVDAIAKQSGRILVTLSATNSSVKDVKEAIAKARKVFKTFHRETILFVDEIHRFSRSQQDTLLPGVENRDVTFMAATTENPSYSIIRPLLSRSIVVKLSALDKNDLSALIDKAITSPRGLNGSVTVDQDAKDMMIDFGAGDARKTLGLLEAATSSHTMQHDGSDTIITVDDVKNVMDSADIMYDRGGDDHYDLASAFIKSMRGSNPDAALHYAARMLHGGEDPRFIVRRVVIAASEDVGLADPTVLQTCVAAATAIEMVGMPEARIPLAEAIIAVASAPKSNAGYLAINKAIADVNDGRGGPVPLHLRNATSREKRSAGYGKDYKYAHDWPHAVSPQEYMPEDMVGTEYYHPSNRGHETFISDRMQKVRSILRKSDDQPS